MLQGVTHGAVDFLIKPVRQEELRNVWQHVVRRKLQVLWPGPLPLHCVWILNVVRQVVMP